MDNQQQGGALMITLVLLFMMSIMGVSSMRSATLEKRMSGNAVHLSTTRQAAESVTELVLGNTNNLEAALSSGIGVTTSPAVNLDSHEALTTDAALTYKGLGPPIGNSLGVNSGFAAIRFEAAGKGEITSVEAQSILVQGAYRIAPSP